MNTSVHPVLKEYTVFILENHLHQYSELLLDLADSKGINIYPGLVQSDWVERTPIITNFSRFYLRAISDKTPEEILNGNENIKRTHSFFSQNQTLPETITRLGILKEALFSLVPLYTREGGETMQIVSELETFHQRLILLACTFYQNKKTTDKEALYVNRNKSLKDYSGNLPFGAEESLKLHAEILESMNEGVIVTDQDGTILYANKAKEKMFGCKSGELIGCKFSDLNSYSSEENGVILDKINTRLKQRGVWTGEFSSIRKDQTPFTTSARITELEINGRTFLVWVQEDITEEKKDLENQKLLDNISTVLSSSLDYKPILKRVANLVVPALADWCMIDLVTKKNKIKRAEIAFHDPSLKPLATKAKKIPVDSNSIYYPSSRAITTGEPVLISYMDKENLEQIFSSEEYVSLIKVIGVKSLLCVPLISRKKIFGAITFVRTGSGIYTSKDLNFAIELARRTSYAIENSKLFKATQEALKNNRITLSNLASAKEQLSTINAELNRKNKELLKTNTDLDNFIYTASHDLRTPIANLEGLFRMLSQDKIPDEHKEIFPYIQTCINRLNKVIKDLTEISRIQTAIEDDQEKVSLEEITGEVLLSMKESIQKEHAVIHTDFYAAPYIIFSRKNLRNILHNLISNALKFRAQERQCEISIQTCLEGDYFVLSVEDNGLGIAGNHKDKIFNMFRRFRDHVEGTGVGLYIVKRLVENQEGKIEVKSEEGKGSIFRILLKQEEKINSPLPGFF